MELSNISLAYGLTLLAGLSTGVGSLIALLDRRTNTAFLSFALGYSAGVMIYVSMVELYPKAQAAALSTWGNGGLWYAAGAFFAGMVMIALIDRLVPPDENPHEPRLIEELKNDRSPINNKKLFRTGAMQPWPLPYTISRKGLQYQCPSIMQPGTEKKLFSTLPCRGYPSLLER